MAITHDTSFIPGLTLFRACTLPALATRLVERWRVPLADPFTPDMLVMPGEGVRRWLSQRVATSPAGVCAGVDFVTFDGLERRLLGDDPAWWRPGRVTWTLLSLLDTDHDPVLAPLRARLDATGEPYELLREIATRFVRYAAYRPELVARWRDGDDQPADAAWQAHLWRSLRARTGHDPAEAYDTLCARLASGDEPDDLPPRVAVVTDGLPPRRWQLVRALASTHQVDVYHLAATPTVSPAVPLNDAAPPDTLLGWLQADVRGDRPPVARTLRPDDRSVQIHLSHGLDRQVEVLRDTLAWLYETDPTLEPRDVVVLTPDVDAVAPLVTASFQLGPRAVRAHPGHAFRVHVVGRSQAQANPCVPLLLRLLRLPDTRMTAADLLELLAEPPIAQRFAITPSAYDRLGELVERARIRWGLNAAHRASFGLGQFPQSTWVDGLQRLLLGVALSGDDLSFVKATLPTDDVDSSDVALLGDLAEFVSRVGRLVDACSSPAPVPQWTARCRDITASLFDLAPADAWQRSELWAGLNRIDQRWQAGVGPDGNLPIGRASAVRVVEDEFTQRQARAGFGDGSTVVCGLDALRHVPHRVVCLLGWDEPGYPRPPSRDGDDLMRLAPQPDDPSPSSADRQALLDAVNAATETLVVVARGRSSVTNRTVALAPPVARLVDALDATAATADGVGAGQAVTLEHPLQASSARNFDGSVPRSFDAAAYRTARAGNQARKLGDRSKGGSRAVGSDDDPAELVLPPLDPERPIVLDDLVTFFKNPARALLRTRMGLSSTRDDPDANRLPLVPDGLQRWKLGDRLLRDALAGRSLGQAIDAERRRGDVPPGKLGARVIDDVSASVATVLASLDRLPSDAGAEPVLHEIAVAVAGAGARVTGHVETRGAAIVHAEFSRAQPRQQLVAWVSLVALAAAVPGPWRAHTVTPNRTRTLEAPSQTDARRILATLVSLCRYGMTRPLPAAPRVNEAWAAMRRERRDPADPRAYSDFERLWRFDQDDAWLTFFPPDVDELLHRPPEADFDIGPADEPTLQGKIARAIWDDLLDHEAQP